MSTQPTEDIDSSPLSGESTQIDYAGQWPSLNNTQLGLIIAINIGSFILAWVLLRLVWKPPTDKQLRDSKELQVRIQALQQQYGSINDTASSTAIECLEGESAGDYSEDWTKTFDLVFLIMMIVLYIALAVWTELTHPELWSNGMFWLEQTPKVGLMMLVSLLGGLCCRYFCKIDEKGYIVTSKSDVFKVNYTRKLQHFAAYMIPLLMHTHAGPQGPLTLTWGNWFTLLGFLILIKPLRERFTFFMLQFNSLDRPEDRPNTISWIVGGNILPGCIMIIFFKWLYAMNGQQDMVYIFVFITGLGDGLAEPVGIYLGKHKYWTTSCFGDRKYQRSWEGSACVFISGIVFVSCFWYTFESALQFWIALAILPPAMAYAEATSPHTIDTPFLMGVGGTMLYVISHINVSWSKA